MHLFFRLFSLQFHEPLGGLPGGRYFTDLAGILLLNLAKAGKKSVF